MKKHNNDQNFTLLSYREECKLTPDEKLSYHKKIREWVKDRRLTNATWKAETLAPKLKGFSDFVTGIVTRILAGGKVEVVSSGQENIPDGPVVFAHTHQGILDNVAWHKSMPRHCLVLHSAAVRKIMAKAQFIIGLIMVDKDEGGKGHRIGAKLDMLKVLVNGHSLSIFPEAAWNMSPNKLHLNLNFGFLDIAQKAGVPVVPVVSEFSYDPNPKRERVTKIHTRYGKPIYLDHMSDLKEKLLEFQEKISTMRWDLIAEKGLTKRSEIPKKYYKHYLEKCVDRLNFGGIKLEDERRLMRDSSNEFYIFHHINDVPVDEEGNLLETEEVRRLRKLNELHNI